MLLVFVSLIKRTVHNEKQLLLLARRLERCVFGFVLRRL